MSLDYRDDDEYQNLPDREREYQPRNCGGCGRPLTNGEVGDLCQECHYHEYDRRER